MVNALVEWFRPEGAVDAGVLADAISRPIAFDGLLASQAAQASKSTVTASPTGKVWQVSTNPRSTSSSSRA